jgi:hypothetical protein
MQLDKAASKPLPMWYSRHMKWILAHHTLKTISHLSSYRIFAEGVFSHHGACTNLAVISASNRWRSCSRNGSCWWRIRSSGTGAATRLACRHLSLLLNSPKSAQILFFQTVDNWFELKCN